jgi:hypothetical protein
MIIGLAARKLHFDRTRAKLCFAINDFEIEYPINKKLSIKQTKKKRVGTLSELAQLDAPLACFVFAVFKSNSVYNFIVPPNVGRLTKTIFNLYYPTILIIVADKVILEIMIVSQCFIEVLSVAINVSRKIIIVADNMSRKNR